MNLRGKRTNEAKKRISGHKKEIKYLITSL